MDTLQTLLLAFIGIVIVNNLVLTKFLGTCPYLGFPAIDMAFGMGCAVTFVVTLAGTLTWLIDHLFLIPYSLEVMRYLCFIMVIAGAVQLVEMYMQVFSDAVRKFRHLFAADHDQLCHSWAVFVFEPVEHRQPGSCSGAEHRRAGVGFTLAICIMAGIRENLSWPMSPRRCKAHRLRW